jgi:hypothetical protein
MSIQPDFTSVWNSVEEFVLIDKGPKYCLYAKKFLEWANALCEEMMNSPDIVSVNQNKVLLLDKYFEWRNFVPKSHRFKVSDVGHRCIFHVFEQAYTLLKVTELSLTPPMLFLPPPPPPPPPPPQIAGLFLGEFDG